ncbi:MAG: choice-of-anchor J domain-containing protein [Dysgonamonadaceae bacterium]|jgi:hypothetical protein|nr:choice-of-anchor J domain-containing protein [Dysgonamonadaceae bacterium]
MKKTMFLTALVAVLFELNAQTLPTKQPEYYKEAKAVANRAIKPISETDIRQTLYAKELKNGAQLRIVELTDGRVKKLLTRANTALRNKISHALKSSGRAKAPLAAAANADTFYEGFEGWDGETENWLPAGWENLSKMDPPTPDAFLWKVMGNTEMGFFPYAGNYMASIQFYFDEEAEVPMQPQDEWLITSTFTPKQDEYLNFRLNYNPAWVRINLEAEGDGQFVFDQNNEQIEVLISEDDGLIWTKIWEVYEDAMSYTDAELENYLSNNTSWFFFNIDLSPYVGKSVKVAFRYANNGTGESAFLDEIKVNIPQPEAVYSKPEGSFYWGLDKDFNDCSENAILNPAYIPVRWAYAKNTATQSVDWAFYSPKTDDFVAVAEENPEIAYPYSNHPAPLLNARRGDIVSVFQWGIISEEGEEEKVGRVAYGGAAEYKLSDGSIKRYSVGNYDLQKNISGTMDGGGNSLFSSNYLEAYGYPFKGVGEYFAKPLAPYVFDTFYVHLLYTEIPDTELKLELIRVDDNDVPQDTIAVSTLMGADIPFPTNEDGVTTAAFTFKAIGDDGRETDTDIEIKDAFVAVLSGFTDNVNVLAQYDDHILDEPSAYVVFEMADKSEFMPVSDVFGWYTSFIFGMNAAFPFLHADDNRYEAPNAGGTKDFVINTYWKAESWRLEELPDWISMENPAYYPETETTVSIPVTVETLPEGVSGRSANIYIASRACNLTLQIKQGDADWVDTNTAITVVKNADAVKVSNQGDRFLLAYPAGTTSVSVYGAAGQKLGEYVLNASGTTSIPTTHLPKGVYILKFAGKTHEVVKVVK